jgi:hypothetical protein
MHMRMETLSESRTFGIADFLLVRGEISLAEKVLSKGSSSDEEDG